MKIKVKLVLWLLLAVVVAGGIWFYVRRNRGEKHLSRAETALKASRLEDADRLAHKYTVKSPGDWRGWCVYAQVELRRGKYEAARKLLAKASEIAPNEILPRISLADSYAWAGRYTMARRRDSVTDEMLVKASADLKKSIEIAEAIKTKDVGQQLDIKQSIGVNARYLGDCYTRLKRRYMQDAAIFEAGSNLAKAKAKRQRGDDVSVEASRAYNLAAKELLDVIKAEPTRKKAGKDLAELCLQQGNLELFDEAREALLSDKSDMPEAKVLIWMDDLRKNRLVYNPPQLKKKIEALAGKVDKLIDKNPKNRRLLLARLELALIQEDNETADSISKKLISLFPMDDQTRLLRAMTLMKQGDNDKAEDILFELKTDFPNWPEAHFLYAQAVQNLGKTGLARQALRYTVQIDPKHAGALKMLVRMMLDEGFAASAYTDALSNYENHRNDPQSLALFIRAGLKAGRISKVREALEYSEENYRDRPAMMLVVAEGYRILGDTQKAMQAIKPAAGGDMKTWQEKLVVAKAKMVSGEIIQAENILNEAYKVAPNSPEVNFALGELYSATDRQMQAIDAFVKACTAAPDNMRYRKVLAEAYYSAGLLRDALREAEKILDVEPQNTPVALLSDQIRIILDMPQRAVMANSAADIRQQSLLQQARTLLQHGKPEKCILLCQKLLDAAPRNISAMLMMAEAYMVLQKFDAAKKECGDSIRTAPNSLPIYLRVARLLRRQYRIGEIEDFFRGVASCKVYYEYVALGWLCEREGKLDNAINYFQKAREYKDTPEDVINAVDIRLAKVYARQGLYDKAIKTIQPLLEKPAWQLQALIAKARIQIEYSLPVDKTFESIFTKARSAKNESLYDALILMALQANKPQFALEVCKHYRQTMPDSSRPYLMSGFVYNYMNDPQAIKMYREAIRVQPMNLRGYIMLARVYNRLNKPKEAMDVLKSMAGIGTAAKSESLLEQSRMLASWGLHLPAVAALEKLNSLGLGNDPQVQYALGSAFALLGETVKAREALVKIPGFAVEYVPAQMLLSALATSSQEKIAILEELLKINPRLPQVRLQLVDALLDSGKKSQAKTQLDEVTGELTDSAVIEPVIAARGVGLLIKIHDYSGAARICQKVATQSNDQGWYYRAMLLRALQNPKDFLDGFVPPQKANLFEAAVGVMASSLADNDSNAWVERFRYWMQSSKSPDVAWFVRRYELLAALSVGQESLDKNSPQKLAPCDMPAPVVDSLVKSKDVARQAAELMACQFAIDTALPSLGEKQLLEILQKYPTCQWAAMLLLGMEVADETLAQVGETIKPSDCFAGRLVQAELLLRKGKPGKAYDIYSEAMKKYPTNELLKYRKAVAAEQAGKLAEALSLYKEIWKATGNPIAANNAAAIISRLYPQNTDELSYASEIMTKVLKMVPNSPAFMDTKGWVEFLRGNEVVARTLLSGAIKGLTGSPEAHYHVGMAQEKSGTLGVWHLQAAISKAKIIQAKTKLSLATQQAVERSREQLQKMKKPL